MQIVSGLATYVNLHAAASEKFSGPSVFSSHLVSSVELGPCALATPLSGGGGRGLWPLTFQKQLADVPVSFLRLATLFRQIRGRQS